MNTKQCSFIELFEKYLPNNKNKDAFNRAYDMVNNAGLLDTNFLQQCVNIDRFKDRLAEIIIAHRTLKSFENECSSNNEGPDLKIEYEDCVINIESIRSSKIIEESIGNFAVIEINPGEANKSYTTQGTYISENDFAIYVGSALLNKSTIYKKYLSNKTIGDNDLNIICLNTGFYDQIKEDSLIQFGYFLYGLPYFVLENTTDEGISTIIEYRPEIFTKRKINDDGTVELIPIESGIFNQGQDSNNFNHIDGLLIIHENNIFGENHKTKGIFYPNMNGRPIPYFFLKKMNIDHYEDVCNDSYSIKKIKSTGYIK